MTEKKWQGQYFGNLSREMYQIILEKRQEVYIWILVNSVYLSCRTPYYLSLHSSLSLSLSICLSLSRCAFSVFTHAYFLHTMLQSCRPSCFALLWLLHLISVSLIIINGLIILRSLPPVSEAPFKCPVQIMVQELLFLTFFPWLAISVLDNTTVHLVT